MHRDPQILAAQIKPAMVPPVAVKSLQKSTLALLRDGDHRAICVRRDLVPGLILIGLVTQGAFAALAIDVADEPPLKLYELIVGAWFPAQAEAAGPAAYQLALNARSNRPARKAVARQRAR